MIEKATNSRVFLIILAVQLCTIFIKQWDYDGGWVLLTIEQLRALNRFSYFYILDDPEYTFVKPFFYLLSLLPADGFSSKAVFLFLLPSALCSAVMLYVVHKINTRFLLDTPTMSGVLIPLLLVNYFSVYGPSGISMRPDIFIMLACAYAIWAHFRLRVDGRPNALLGSIMVSGIALSFHPIGMLAGLINLFSFFQNIRRMGQAKVLSVLLVGAVSIGLAIMLLLWGKTFGEFWVDFEKIADDREHFAPFFHEHLRYLRLTYYYGLYGAFVTFLVLVALFGTLFGWYRMSDMRHAEGGGQVANRKDVQSIFLLSFFCLFIFPIKWSHYVGPVIVPLALLAPCLIAQLFDKIYLRYCTPYLQKILDTITASVAHMSAQSRWFLRRVWRWGWRKIYGGLGWALRHLCRISDVKAGLNLVAIVFLAYTGISLAVQLRGNYYVHNLLNLNTKTTQHWDTMQSFHLGHRIYGYPFLMPHYSLSNLAKLDRTAAPLGGVAEDYVFLEVLYASVKRDCPPDYVHTMKVAFSSWHLLHCEMHAGFPRYFYNYRFFE